MSIIKTEAPEFDRDSGSGALINNDVNAYTLYKQTRQQQRDTSSLQGQIDNLKTDIKEIKNLLTILIQRDSNGTFNS